MSRLETPLPNCDDIYIYFKEKSLNIISNIRNLKIGCEFLVDVSLFKRIGNIDIIGIKLLPGLDTNIDKSKPISSYIKYKDNINIGNTTRCLNIYFIR